MPSPLEGKKDGVLSTPKHPPPAPLKGGRLTVTACMAVPPLRGVGGWLGEDGFDLWFRG
jgi:hypothetical protein